MSVMPQTERTRTGKRSVELDIIGRTRELGDGITLRRLLPSATRRLIGPFIFFDHVGPLSLAPDHGLDVRPHPHINLAAVTYLFDGEILHRDHLGCEQLIRPGSVNWMTAGRGIVHSERSPLGARKTGPRMHGLQLWLGLPKVHEEVAPSFQHCPVSDVPTLELRGKRLRILAGAAFGVTAPVKVLSPLFYVDAELERFAEVELPEEYAGRGAYVIHGAIASDDEARRGVGAMLSFRERVPARIRALEPSRVIVFGGARLDGERHLVWNFVSSSMERIERAKREWKEGGFAKVPGDEDDFIPLPSEFEDSR